MTGQHPLRILGSSTFPLIFSLIGLISLAHPGKSLAQGAAHHALES